MNVKDSNSSNLRLFYKNFAHIPHIKKIYEQWAIYNSPFYIKYFILISVLIFALEVLLDFLWFDSVEPYINLRFAFIIGMFVLFVLYERLFNVKGHKFDLRKYTFNLFLLTPALSANIIYLYYLLNAPESDYTIVLLANFFVIIISTLFMYRFWKEQYLLNFLCIAIILGLAYYNPLYVRDCIRLVYFHIISFVVAFYYRNQFLDNLHKKFIHISSLVPMQIAKYYTISEGRESLESIFKSQERYTVCLCSDWRNYQKFAEEHNYKDLSNFIEIFYDIIFDKLELLFPNGEYYTDWTADELFIVFYGENDDKDEIIKKSLSFAHSLATDIYLTISSNLKLDLCYDIGISAGVGYLGLQGPNRFKKTTITGKPAIIAKRLESEGKSIREKDPKHSFPHLLIDADIHELAKENHLFSKHPFNKVISTNNALKDLSIFNWQFQD